MCRHIFWVMIAVLDYSFSNITSRISSEGLSAVCTEGWLWWVSDPALIPGCNTQTVFWAFHACFSYLSAFLTFKFTIWPSLKCLRSWFLHYDLHDDDGDDDDSTLRNHTTRYWSCEYRHLSCTFPSLKWSKVNCWSVISLSSWEIWVFLRFWSMRYCWFEGRWIEGSEPKGKIEVLSWWYSCVTGSEVWGLESYRNWLKTRYVDHGWTKVGFLCIRIFLKKTEAKICW